jgi:hypothetical protein
VEEIYRDSPFYLVYYEIKFHFEYLEIRRYRELLNLYYADVTKKPSLICFTFVSVDSLNLFFVCIRVCLQKESIVFTRVVDTEFSLCFFLSLPRGIQLSYLPNNPVRA